MLTDSIVDINSIPSVSVENSRSATDPSTRDQVDQQIREEIHHGHYTPAEGKPKIVSALAAIPKSNGDIRLIHDLSRPEESCLNSYATKEPFQSESVEDAINIVKESWYMAKVDLKSAYRTVPIHPSQYPLTGLQWTFKDRSSSQFFMDTRLPFGARKSPAVFHRLTQAVKRMMLRKGYPSVVVYLDDFFVTGKTFSECMDTYNTLISLLRSLGFWINWNKLCDPSTKVTFLGVTIDTIQGTLSLQTEKVDELCSLIQAFKRRNRASRRQLESLAGKLAWAAHVIPWGRTHLRPIFDLIATLNQPSHKAKLLPIQDSLAWWELWLRIGNNTKPIWDKRPLLHIYTDSSTSAGGAFCCGDWYFSNWHEDSSWLEHEHINVKELAAICIAAKRWGPRFENHHIILHTDSQVAEAMVNNGTTRNSACLYLLKKMSALALRHNFALTAVHIPGKDNIFPDAISRLHERGQVSRFYNACMDFYANMNCIPVFNLVAHMSCKSMLSILPQILQWKPSFQT